MKPNVLLVVMDSVRARNTSLHGHGNRTTPFLEAFADRATVYEQARAPGARSITSHASLFTGLEVAEHRITSADHKLHPDTTVFEQLQDEGYETGVFSENVWITDVDIGLKEGFDRVVGPQNVPFPDALNPRKLVAEEGKGQYREFLQAALESETPGRSLLNGVHTKLSFDAGFLPDMGDSGSPGNLYRDRFFDWIDSLDGPWGACVNLMDAHAPYNPKPEFDEWGDEKLRQIEAESPEKWELHAGTAKWWQRTAREALYDGTIRQVDNYVGDIVNGLAERGILDDTLVVVTSDHGEGFGEWSTIRGTRIAGHNVSTHEVLLHVPLVVKLPGQQEGTRVESPAALTRFPDAVHAALDDRLDTSTFVPDEPVVATTYGLTEDDQLRARASQYCEDLSAFDGVTNVVYEEEAGKLHKYVSWKSKGATLEIRDAQTSYKTADEGQERVDEVFDQVEGAGVRESAGGIEEVDQSTYDRLEDLGYV
jgi:arylsulfatase A-like enzyme